MARVKTHLELGRMRKELEARVHDRTRLLVESESRLQQKVAESEHIRKQQEIVVDLTSHELRNPLNAVWQSAELLEGGLARMRELLAEKPPCSCPNGGSGIAQIHSVLEEAEDAVESIILSVAHQARIADDILNFSKISMSLLTVHRIPFHLFDTIQDVCRMWEIEAKERNISLSLTASPELRNMWVLTDPQRCSQIIINFLTNAIRFTSDAPTRRINVFLRQFSRVPPAAPNVHRIAGDREEFPDGFWLNIGVQDSGPGLSTDNLERLFERFSQAHPSKDQFSGGHGLGLFVSRHLVMLLDGFIEVESVPGQGCTFSFSIPVEQAEPSDYHDQNKGWRVRILGRSTKTKVSSPRVEPVQGHSQHVLVVEDNIINQKVLVRQLQTKGFRTSVASDGQEALDLILDAARQDIFPYDLALMDIEMPVKDGRTACRELREAEKCNDYPHLPVIAVTGNAREEQIDECLDAGFDEVAIKPYRITDITRLMNSVMSTRELGSTRL